VFKGAVESAVQKAHTLAASLLGGATPNDRRLLLDRLGNIVARSAPARNPTMSDSDSEDRVYATSGERKPLGPWGRVAAAVASRQHFLWPLAALAVIGVVQQFVWPILVWAVVGAAGFAYWQQRARSIAVAEQVKKTEAASFEQGLLEEESQRKARADAEKETRRAREREISERIRAAAESAAAVSREPATGSGKKGKGKKAAADEDDDDAVFHMAAMVNAAARKGGKKAGINVNDLIPATGSAAPASRGGKKASAVPAAVLAEGPADSGAESDRGAVSAGGRKRNKAAAVAHEDGWTHTA